MQDRQKNLPSLVEGDIRKHLVRLALPAIGGMLAITIFNLTDTFFISRLGTESLAAMGFTFPVIMIVGALSTGMALGAGSVLARAMGSGDQDLMNRTASDGILLAILAVLIISTAGLLSLDPLFRFLGADETTLPLVKEYMQIWYFGAVAIIMPPVGDSTMRAMGDMKRPFIVMMVCALGNMILDPILIFGLFGIPAMGIRGAALATIIARIGGMITTLSFLHFHYHILNFKYNKLSELFTSWRRILHIGLPAAAVRLFPQLLRAVITRLAALVGGTAAVAAVAAGSRIEGFAMIVAGSVGMALIPLIGQNWGAGNMERITVLRLFINKSAIVYGIILFLLSLPFAAPIARIFTSSPEVIEKTVLYIRIIFLGTAGLNLYNWTSETLNAAGKPRWVLLINILGTSLIIIPLTWTGAGLLGFGGMLGGLAAGQLILGVVSILIGRRELFTPCIYPSSRGKDSSE